MSSYMLPGLPWVESSKPLKLWANPNEMFSFMRIAVATVSLHSNRNSRTAGNKLFHCPWFQQPVKSCHMWSPVRISKWGPEKNEAQTCPWTQFPGDALLNSNHFWNVFSLLMQHHTYLWSKVQPFNTGVKIRQGNWHYLFLQASIHHLFLVRT